MISQLLKNSHLLSQLKVFLVKKITVLLYIILQYADDSQGICEPEGKSLPDAIGDQQKPPNNKIMQKASDELKHTILYEHLHLCVYILILQEKLLRQKSIQAECLSAQLQGRSSGEKGGDDNEWMGIRKPVKSRVGETKHGGSKNGKKEGLSGSSFFTWFMVIALLGVWTSVAVVWFELVDYEEVLGKLGIYDADGDGDFDVEDAKVLLGKYKYGWSLTKDGSNENIDSLEEVLNILAEESSDWFYGFLSFLYDVLTPFEILEEEESEAADDVDVKEAIKEPLKKLREKQESKKQEIKDEEEKKKTRKGKDATDRKDKKAVDMNKLKKDSDKAKRDRGKEKGLDKNVKSKETTKKSTSEKDGTIQVGKDKETKKIVKNQSKEDKKEKK
ncbi:aspartyl/asparaginyl beta-hydroxylase-like protein [Pitangus sulphuratus]|nr:aspartyl/asparaginyl beta-hydroxylase-like protein [Pitangus sulphuratus]